MNLTIKPVPVSAFHQTWPLVEGYLEEALKWGEDDYTKDQAKALLAQGSWLLLVAVDEELGFLPGTLNEKMAPWIMPIVDNFRNAFSRSMTETPPLWVSPIQTPWIWPFSKRRPLPPRHQSHNCSKKTTPAKQANRPAAGRKSNEILLLSCCAFSRLGSRLRHPSNLKGTA